MKEKENLTIKKVKEILDDAYSILSKNYDIIDTVELNLGFIMFTSAYRTSWVSFYIKIC